MVAVVPSSGSTRRTIILTIVIVVLDCIAFPVLVNGQATPAGGEKTAQEELETFLKMPASEVARKYLSKPPYSLLAIRRLIELGDPQVAPDLRRAFADEEDVTRRRFIAAALVSLGDRDERYFDYVRDGARTAIHNQLPFPQLLNQVNRPGVYRPEFVEVVREQGLKLDAALQQAAIELPAAVEALGEAADMRAVPVLLEGLDSPNIAIARASAFGLARLHNNAQVSPIIAACARFSREERPVIAKALLYFDSRTARRAARSIIHNPQVLERWQREANQRGWKNAMRDNPR